MSPPGHVQFSPAAQKSISSDQTENRHGYAITTDAYDGDHEFVQNGRRNARTRQRSHDDARTTRSVTRAHDDERKTRPLTSGHRRLARLSLSTRSTHDARHSNPPTSRPSRLLATNTTSTQARDKHAHTGGGGGGTVVGRWWNGGN